MAVGLIAAPGLASEVADAVSEKLAGELAELYPDGDWAVPVLNDGLVEPPAPTTELVDAAHGRLMSEDWELAICLTDLPLRIGRRTIAGHASPTHRLAVISVPALGPARVQRRVLETAIELLAILLGDGREPAPREGQPRMRRRLIELSELADENPETGPTGLAALISGGRLRLLGGMVRANHPWRLAARLYRALIAAFATLAFAAVTVDIWRLSETIGSLRLVILMVLSIGLTTASLIVVHGLWRTGRHGQARDQVLLFNAASSLTVAIGILSLYLALWVIALATTALVVTPQAFSDTLGSQADVGDYLTLSWFMSSLATVGGALGAGLESDAAIREAAYARRDESDDAAVSAPPGDPT
ncbi:hypothetical protein HJD18_06830 [Thermoleophilia bacterium SCSIO 60948]|nr:hypothetical protein HJD18_06830 [Thermoleophilia bacterium SCSIO 60948]